MPARQPFVGVVSYYPALPKQYLLLFDSIVMNSSEDLLDLFAAVPDDKLRQQVADLRYLQEKGVLRLMFPSREFQEQYARELLEFEEAVEENTPLVLDMPEGVGSNEKLERVAAADRTQWDKTNRDVGRVEDARARLTAIQLRLNGVNAVPILSTGMAESSRVTSVDVVRVTLDALPVPAPDTPLEALLEFRQDEEAKGSIAALHRWMRKPARQAVSFSELKDELDELLDVYVRQMKIHRMKYENARLRSLVTFPLELIEGIAKLKLASAASKPFDIREERIGLLEAELLGPGNEVAFIARARDELEQPPSQPSSGKVGHKPPNRAATTKRKSMDAYVRYLTEQGYEPKVSVGDRWNHIDFVVNGRGYLLALDTEDADFCAIVYPDFWSVEREDLRQFVGAAVAANTANGGRKLVKIYFDEQFQKASASVQMLVEHPNYLVANFPKLIGVLQSAVAEFGQYMTEYLKDSSQ